MNISLYYPRQDIRDYEGEEVLSVLLRYIDDLRKAYKSLPTELKDKNVKLKVSPHYVRLCDREKDLAAQCFPEYIIFYPTKQPTYPSYESIRWLLAHELGHRKLNHHKIEKGSTLKEEEIEKECFDYTEHLGIKWEPEMNYKSSF